MYKELKGIAGGYSIRTRLSLYISATVMAACALVCAVVIAWEWQERKADVEEHVGWLAANAALLSAPALAAGDNDKLSAIAETIVSTEEGRSQGSDDARMYASVEILDMDGHALASESFGMDADDLSAMSAMRQASVARPRPGAWKDESTDCSLYGAYHPVMYGGRMVGAVNAGTCDMPARAEMLGNIRDSAVLLLAAGLLGALVGRRISGRFSGPIGELVRGAGEFSAGNLDYRVELGRNSYREMQILASGFNTMAAALKDKIASLEASRADAVGLNEKLKASYEEAVATARKLERMNEWSTDLAFGLEEANRRLKQEALQTETIVHSIKDGIVALDRDENIILLNPEAEELFGVTTADARGMNVKLLVDRLVEKISEPEAFLAKFMAATASPDSESEFNITVLRPYRRVLRRHSSAIKGEGGELAGRVVTFVDITRQKEIDDMKSNFVSTVSHELRTPLTSIKGALTLLRDEELLDQDTRRDFLAIAEHNADRLVSLITNLLDLSRMESGMVSLNLTRFDLAELTEETARSAGIPAASDRIRIEVERTADATEVLADRDKIAQAVSNLLDNAVKFSPPGSRVRVVVGSDDDGLTVTVTDEGPGIPPDKLDKVFEKFYQVDMSATRKVGGSGLGLSICRAVVSEHGGEVKAVSPVKDARGSCFVLRLPHSGISSKASMRPGGSAALRPDTPPSVPGSRGTVLLVDDDPAFLKLQRSAFELEGYRVLAAKSGMEAIDIAREQLPGFIFLDVMLPDMDGMTVAGILKQDPATSGIPIVFATGLPERDLPDGRELGAGLMLKPLETAQMLNAVKQYYG